MIADISSVIDSLIMQNHSYSVFSISITDGEATPIYATPTTLRCGVLPMGGKELKTFPDGQFTIEDKIILTHATADLKVKDRIIANGNTYEIKNEFDVSDLVGIKKFIASKVSLV